MEASQNIRYQASPQATISPKESQTSLNESILSEKPAEVLKGFTGFIFQARKIESILMPLEAFLQTFQHLSIEDLLAARQTCRDWKVITDYVVRHKHFTNIRQASYRLFDRFVHSIRHCDKAQTEFLFYYGRTNVDELAKFKDVSFYFKGFLVNFEFRKDTGLLPDLWRHALTYITVRARSEETIELKVNNVCKTDLKVPAHSKLSRKIKKTNTTSRNSKASEKDTLNKQCLVQ